MISNRKLFPKLEGLSIRQLEQLKSDIEKSISSRKKDELYESIKMLAKEAGVDLVQLLAERDATEKPTKLYVNPNDPSKTWSGKGRHPNWFKDLVRSGYEPEQILSQNQGSVSGNQ